MKDGRQRDMRAIKSITPLLGAGPGGIVVRMSRLRTRIRVGLVGGLCLALVVSTAERAVAQQFNSDNQWVAPHGAGTFILTVGQEYSILQAVAALIPETEFNIGVTHFSVKPFDLNEGHYSGLFYIKRRLYENKAGTGGWAVSAGTGIYPGYLSQGEVTDTFQSWWANVAYTIPFRDGAVTWDLLPGGLLNLDKDQTGENAWGFTYSSRVAVYKLVPHSAVVGEVFGTAGEAYSEPVWRLGVRWESPHVIVAGTYGAEFDGSGGPGFEIGVMVLTNPLGIFCLGGGCSD